MTTAQATSRHGNRVFYYECRQASVYGSADCTVRRVNAAHLHNALVGEIARMAEHPWRIRTHIERAAERMTPTGQVEAELKAARKRLAECNKRVDKLAEAVALSGAAVIKVLARKITDEEQQRAMLEEEVRRSEVEVAKAKAWRPDIHALQETLRLFGQVWEQRTDGERAQLLRLIVDRVEMKNRQEAQATILPALSQLLRFTPRGVYSKCELRDLSRRKYHNPRFHDVPIRVRGGGQSRGKRSSEQATSALGQDS
jgi:DNA repair exonuclease SbcCD ATPase subunit